MAISFNQIPANLGVPGAYGEFDTTRMRGGLVNQRQKVLLFGQKLAAGTATAGKVIRVNSRDEARAFYGRGSMLATMVEKFLQNAIDIPLYAVALADPAGDKASGGLVITGTVTQAGTLYTYIGGRRVGVGLPTGTTAAVAAQAIYGAINADPDMQMVATLNDATVTLTARHAGTVCNGLDIRLSYHGDDLPPAGLAFNIIQPTAGTGEVSLQTAMAYIGDEVYSHFVAPYTDVNNTGAMESILAERSDALHQLDGVYLTAKTGYPGSVSSLQTLGDYRNSAFSIIVGSRGIPNPPWEVAAAVAAQAAASVQEDPGLPFTGLPLKGILAPIKEDRMTAFPERQYLLNSGISTVKTDGSDNLVIERIVTTYKRNSFGIEDTSLKSYNSMALLFFLRFSWNYRIQTRYPRHKLGNDSTNYGRGQPVMTPNTSKAEAVAIFGEWEEAALVEDPDQFKRDLVCERDPDNRDRLNMVMPPNLINQFLVNATKFQPIL